MNLLHWAENQYQKLEKACTTSEVVQVPCRYVDAVSDRIKHVLDELNDYVNPYNGLSDETDFSNISVGCTESVVKSDLSSMKNEGSSHHQNIHETDSSDVYEVYMESMVESNISSMEDEGSSQNAHEPDSSDLSEDSFESALESNVSSSQNIHEPDSLESAIESNVSSMEDEGLTQNIHDPDSLESVVESNISSMKDEGSTQNIHEPNSLESMVESNVFSSDSEDLKFPNMTEEDSNIPDSVNSPKTIGSKISDENAENIKNDKHIISSKGELSLVTSLGLDQELSRQIRCDERDLANVTHFPESSHNITPSESHENELIDEGSIGPDTTLLTEAHENCMSQETVSLLRSLIDEHDQQHDLNKVDTPEQHDINKVGALEQLSETKTVTEILDDNYMEDIFTTINTVIPTRVLMDSFEDVNLNTCWEDIEDAENFEFVVTPNHVSTKLPEKMKLKNIFISKILAAKRNKKVKNQSYVTDIEINAQSSNFIESSCGSDWVLL